MVAVPLYDTLGAEAVIYIINKGKNLLLCYNSVLSSCRVIPQRLLLLADLARCDPKNARLCCPVRPTIYYTLQGIYEKSTRQGYAIDRGVNEML